MRTGFRLPIDTLAIRRALKVRFRRQARHQCAAGTLDLKECVSAITRRGLTVLLMLVVSWLVGYLPGVGIVLFRGIPLLLLLTAGIAVAAVLQLLDVYRQVVCVLCHLAWEKARLPPGEPVLDAAVVKLAWSVTLLVYVLIFYAIFTGAFSPIVSLLTSRQWPFTLMDLGFLVAAVAAIIGVFIGVAPLFGHLGNAVARRVHPEPEVVPQAKCQKCGVLNPAESLYCSFCGKMLIRPIEIIGDSHRLDVDAKP